MLTLPSVSIIKDTPSYFTLASWDFFHMLTRNLYVLSREMKDPNAYWNTQCSYCRTHSLLFQGVIHMWESLLTQNCTWWSVIPHWPVYRCTAWLCEHQNTLGWNKFAAPRNLQNIVYTKNHPTEYFLVLRDLWTIKYFLFSISKISLQNLRQTPKGQYEGLNVKLL